MTRKYSSFSKETQQEILKEFCEALLALRNTDEVLKFLTDLLTRAEILMLAKRIKIAKLLIEGEDYRTIEGLLKVSHPTIAKVADWLGHSGEGFRLIAQRTKKRKSKPSETLLKRDWKSFKRSHPMMFWPELILRDIIKSAKKSQKERLYKTLVKLDKKSLLNKEMKEILRNDF